MILITRALEQSLTTKRDLLQIGVCDTHIEPAMQLNIIDDSDWFKIDENLCDLIVTSVNVFENAAISRYCNAKLVTIGSAVAEVAKANGFSKVVSVGQNVRDLLEYLQSHCLPGKQFLYMRGRHITCDIASVLLQRKFEVMQQIVYSMDPLFCFSDQLLKFMEHGMITAVMIYSIRSAKLFCDLVSKHYLVKECESMKFYVLSVEIGSCMPYGNILVASAPNHASMIELVEKDLGLGLVGGKILHK